MVNIQGEMRNALAASCARSPELRGSTPLRESSIIGPMKTIVLIIYLIFFSVSLWLKRLNIKYLKEKGHRFSSVSLYG
jgi:hypothetical protein